MSLRNRTLADVADELHAALRRETQDILTVGSLLIEAKAHVRHGEWLSWLKQQFCMSDRSAQKYMKAAEFAVKNELGSDLKLSPSALYLLSEDCSWGKGHGRREATDAVIKAAKERRVGYDRTKEIIDKTIAEISAAEDAKSKITDARGHEKAKSKANARDELVFNFTTIVLELHRITKNKPGKRFVKTLVPADDLARLGKLLTDIANSKNSSASSPSPTMGSATASPEQSAEQMKAKHAALDALADIAA